MCNRCAARVLRNYRSASLFFGFIAAFMLLVAVWVVVEQLGRGVGVLVPEALALLLGVGLPAIVGLGLHAARRPA